MKTLSIKMERMNHPLDSIFPSMIEAAAAMERPIVKIGGLMLGCMMHQMLTKYAVTTMKASAIV